MLQIFYNRKGEKVFKPINKKVKKRVSVYGIYVRFSKLLAVIPTWSDQWDLPGGALDNSEDDITALKREFIEETGYSILKSEKLPINAVKSNFYSDDEDVYYHSTMRFFRILGLEKRKRQKIYKNEIKKVVWLPINKLSGYPTKTYILKIIQNLYK